MSQMTLATMMPVVFGDERDQVLKKFNQIQACWGVGKGVYNASSPFVVFGNQYNKFKYIAYSRLPTSRDEDGLVALHVNKSTQEAKTVWKMIITTITELLGQLAAHKKIVMEGVRPLPDNCMEITMYISQPASLGSQERIAANVLFNFLQTNKAKLEPHGVTAVYPKLGLDQATLKGYLDTPPVGFTQPVWEHAKELNPDPTKFVPTPVVGFDQLLQRVKQQDEETKQHAKRLQVVSSDITELERKHTATVAKIDQARRKLKELHTRVLRLMVAQEIQRKGGYSLQEDEEMLRVRLDGIQNALKNPAQYKGRLNELISQVRLQSQSGLSLAQQQFTIEPQTLAEYKEVIKEQQEGISQLVKIVKEDSEDVSVIEEGLTAASR